MASIDPQDYKSHPDLLILNPANGDRGPDHLDAQTVAAFQEAVMNGFFQVNPDWGPSIVAATQDDLEEAFAKRLRESRLGESSPVLHHRRLALFEALRDLGTPGAVPGFGISVHNVSRAIGDVETWLEGKRQELALAGLDDEQVVRMLLHLTPTQLGQLLQTSEANLSRWRTENGGPRFVRLTQRSAVYPVIAVLEWLDRLQGGGQR